MGDEAGGKAEEGLGVVERLEELGALHVSVKAAEYARAANGVFEAQRAFTNVCRDDLWYLPKWWQVYRLEWWRGRRWRRRRPT